MQCARLQHGVSSPFDRGLEQLAGLVEDLEVVRVIVNRAGVADQLYLDPEIAPRGRRHLAVSHPGVSVQDQLSASFGGTELDPVALSADLRERLLAAQWSA